MNLEFEKLNVYEDEGKEPYSSTFIVEPCEVGFGTTFGNALRRTMMSSMPGVAVIGFKADGVKHEFMTIPGTATDGVELCAALKKLRFKADSEGVHTVRLRTDEAGIYRADSLLLPEGVHLLTPDVPLVNALGEKELELEFYVRKGRGFKGARQHTEFAEDEGVVQVDGNFSPIKRVAYHVRPCRVGNNPNFESLVMEVLTDGSTEPIEAVGIAYGIIKAQLECFEQEKIKNIAEKTAVFRKEKEEEEFVLSRSIAELDLSHRSANGLAIANIKTLEQLVNMNEAELLTLKNLGKKSVKEIKEKLAEWKLHLRVD